MFDQHQQVQYANAAVENLFEHAPSEVVGQDVAMLQPEHLREAHRQGLARFLQTGQKTLDWRSIELTGLHRDGREIPLV